MRLLPSVIVVLATLAAAPDSAVALTPLLSAAATDSADAARQAAAMTGGRVVDVRASRRDGVPVYVVKVVLDDGRVKVISVEGVAAEEP